MPNVPHPQSPSHLTLCGPQSTPGQSVASVHVLRFQHHHDMRLHSGRRSPHHPGAGETLPVLVVLCLPVTMPSCSAGSILKNQEDTFAAELHRLKQQPLFSLVDFEQVVDGIRSTVAEVCLAQYIFLARKWTRSPEVGFFCFFLMWLQLSLEGIVLERGRARSGK